MTCFETHLWLSDRSIRLLKWTPYLDVEVIGWRSEGCIYSFLVTLLLFFFGRFLTHISVVGVLQSHYDRNGERIIALTVTLQDSHGEHLQHTLVSFNNITCSSLLTAAHYEGGLPKRRI